MWENFYKLRSNEDFRDMWESFISGALHLSSKPSPIFLMDAIIRSKNFFSFTKAKKAGTVKPMGNLERNALRYVAGYACGVVTEGKVDRCTHPLKRSVKLCFNDL